MNSYDTLLEVINDLQTKGYTYDFNLKTHCWECISINLQLKREEFEVHEIFSFEGMSNPDDNSILYAISSKEGIKGLLVDAYGVYSEELTEKMRLKLSKK